MTVSIEGKGQSEDSGSGSRAEGQLSGGSVDTSVALTEVSCVKSVLESFRVEQCNEVLFQPTPQIIIRGFMGTTEEALKYLQRDYYISLTGYLCKDKSDTGVRKLLEDGRLPLERLLVETDSPFMYPNTRASKLPQHVKTGLTERSLLYLHRYCTFQRNEPCSLPAIVEMIAAFMNKKPEDVGLATAFNALKLFGLSQ